MEINAFDDRNNNFATVRIISDDPVMEKMLAAVLSPAFIPVSGDAAITVVCIDGELPEADGPCIYVGRGPSEKRDDIRILERPLDIELFYLTCLEICRTTFLSEGGWSYDKTAKTASFKGSRTNLTDKEGQLFALLLSRIGSCVSREEIESTLWDQKTQSNSTDVYVCLLRKKLEKLAGHGVLISVRGTGYMLKKQ